MKRVAWVGSTQDGVRVRRVASRAFLLALVVLAGGARRARTDETSTIRIADDERWWAGVISQSHRMPLHDKPYTFDAYANTAGNQVQPLLISDQGRYIWSEDPFRFEFRDGAIHLSSRFGPVRKGKQGSTLKAVYRYASQTFFPTVGKIPDPVLFTHPQFNTW
ncbi:MAG: hypothetical protein ACYTAS_09615, partial [Planctomycetota bacterium]